MPKRRPKTRGEAEGRYRGAVVALRGQMERNVASEKEHGESVAIRSVSVYSLKRAIGEYEAAVKNLDRFQPGFREQAIYEPRYVRKRRGED